MAQATDISITDPRIAGLLAQSTFTQSAEPSTMSNDGDDTALLALGHRAAALELWFDAQEGNGRDCDAEYDRKLDQHAELIKRIGATPARTADGLRVKAECIIYFRKMIGDPDDTHEPETDGILGFSLARDLLKVGGPSDNKLISLCDRVVAHEKNLDKFASDERDYDDIPECVRSERGVDVAIATIISTRAASMAGLQAKARVVLLNDDYGGEVQQYVQVAQSLARDVARHSHA
jgi:hypothetical protein